jgi:hypothetical protein
MTTDKNDLLSCWVSAENELPAFNTVVVAFLVGANEHSGMSWDRRGYAFMVRHNPEKTEFTVADGWATRYYDDALKKLGADWLRVTHWHYLLPEPTAT